MRVTYRHLGLALAVLFYVAIVAGGQSAFSTTASLDSLAIERLAQDGETSDGAYGMMAALYLLIPDGMHMPLTVAIGLISLYFCFFRVRHREAALALAFLSAAPSILTLSAFQKDTILALFVLASLLVLLTRWPPLWKVLGVLAVYAAYATLFRSYYSLIAVFFVLLLVLRRGHRLAFFYGVLLMGFSLFFVPPEVYETLQGSRDVVNTYRLGRPLAEQPRTAFLNPYAPDGFWNFVLNYLYAIFRLNFYVVVSPGLKELFLLANIVFYIGFFGWSYLRQPGAAGIAGALGLAHLLVLHLFEPDNGSYVRHLGSTLPYLAVCLNAFFATHRVRFVPSQPTAPEAGLRKSP